MCSFAARLPFTNFAPFDFREVDRDLERAEVRRFFFPLDAAPEEREARFLRRLVPPTRELLERVPPRGNIPIHELTTTHLR